MASMKQRIAAAAALATLVGPAAALACDTDKTCDIGGRHSGAHHHPQGNTTTNQTTNMNSAAAAAAAAAKSASSSKATVGDTTSQSKSSVGDVQATNGDQNVTTGAVTNGGNAVNIGGDKVYAASRAPDVAGDTMASYANVSPCVHVETHTGLSASVGYGDGKNTYGLGFKMPGSSVQEPVMECIESENATKVKVAQYQAVTNVALEAAKKTNCSGNVRLVDKILGDAPTADTSLYCNETVITQTSTGKKQPPKTGKTNNPPTQKKKTDCETEWGKCKEETIKLNRANAVYEYQIGEYKRLGVQLPAAPAATAAPAAAAPAAPAPGK